MAWETGNASNHKDLLARLRRFITGRAELSTPVYTGTGNGALSSLDTDPTAITETWTLTCTATATNGGTFSVVGSVTGAQPDATVGVAYVGPILRFLISDGTTDFIMGDHFVFNATVGSMSTEGVAWDLLRSDANTLMVKGKGLGGTDEIYVNFTVFENVGLDIYNWLIQGAAGYISANQPDDQPGQCSKIGLSLWNNPMKYWFIANSRRVIVVAKVSTFYIAGYFGLMLPYGTPSQYPYPLFIGANIPNHDNHNGTAFYNTKNYSWNDFQNTNYWNPAANFSNHYQYSVSRNDETQAQIYWVDGTWYDLHNGYSQGDGGGQAWTENDFNSNYISPVNNDWQRDNIDGTYELVPHTLQMSNPALAVAGELDGSFQISGFSNGAENTITIGSDTYLVVQNVFRNGTSDFAAILLA